MIAGEVYSINIDTIEREVAKMFGPSQQFEIITAAHGLHDHKRIAVAIYKALRTESSFFLSPEGYATFSVTQIAFINLFIISEYETVRRTYLDSKIFLHELRTTDDIIAATLLGSETGRLQKYFTNLGAADKARVCIPVILFLWFIEYILKILIPEWDNGKYAYITSVCLKFGWNRKGFDIRASSTNDRVCSPLHKFY